MATLRHIRFWRKRRQEDQGAAAVEFALILPLLLTFLVGVVTYGYIMAFQQGITTAAAEGARSAAITAVDKTVAERSTAATTAVNHSISTFNTTCGEEGLTCTVTVEPCVGDTTRNCASVKVSYDWEGHPRVPMLPLLPAPEKIEHTAVIEVS